MLQRGMSRRARLTAYALAIAFAVIAAMALCMTSQTRAAFAEEGVDARLAAGALGGSDSSLAVQADGTKVSQVQAGKYWMDVVTEDGVLWVWGDGNSNGRLGTNSANDVLSPKRLLDNVQKVDISYSNGVALKTDGAVYTWGDGYALGNGGTTDSLVPVQVTDGAKDVAAGQGFTLVLKNDNTLWACGTHTMRGQGDDVYENDYRFVKVLDDVATMSAGDDCALAVKSDGTLWSWGYNYYGQIGNGTKKTQYAPVKIADGVASVVAEDAQVGAIKTDGTLWVWGRNYGGYSLGVGGGEDVSKPVKILDGVASLTWSCDGSNGAAIGTDGSLWAWGRNVSGQIGDGTKGDAFNRLSPYKVMDGVSSAAWTTASLLAVKTNGELWGSGSLDVKLYGNHASYNYTVPVQITSGISEVFAGDFHAAAVTTDKDLLTWGYNGEGQIGDGSTDSRTDNMYNVFAQASYTPTGDTVAGTTVEPVSMYRLYNPYSGEHFYTSDLVERNNTVSAGWYDEGTGWIAPATSNTPVYRVYNPYAGEHHYTMDLAERDNLVSIGWKDEGIGWYSDDAQTVPLYRDYNPYEFANNHNYTVDVDEHNNLVNVGWVAEGFAWYGI